MTDPFFEEFADMSSFFSRGQEDPSYALLGDQNAPPTQPQKSPVRNESSDDCVDTTLGIIGRENSGKTAFLNSLLTQLPRKPLPSKLHFSFTASDVAHVLTEQERVQRDVKAGALGATVDPKDGKFTLYHGVKPRVNFRFREVIGQALVSQDEWRSELTDYQTHLAGCDVIWVVIPTPPSDADKTEVARFEKDLMLTKSFLMSALGQRRNPKPCSVALVLTKLDTHFQTEELAREELTDENLFNVVESLVTMLEDVEEVWNAAIFPVSAFGFSNAEELAARLGDGDSTRLADDGGQAGVSRYVEGERLYVLKPDAVMEPFNAKPLVLWSLVAAMIHKEVEGSLQESDNSLAKIWSMLLSDLEAVPSLCSVVKKRLPGG